MGLQNQADHGLVWGIRVTVSQRHTNTQRLTQYPPDYVCCFVEINSFPMKIGELKFYSLCSRGWGVEWRCSVQFIESCHLTLRPQWIAIAWFSVLYPAFEEALKSSLTSWECRVSLAECSAPLTNRQEIRKVVRINNWFKNCWVGRARDNSGNKHC